MNTQTLNKFFRLRRYGKKLESEEYSICLKRYLDTSRSVKQVTLPDLQNTLTELQKSLFDKNSEQISAVSNVSLGEHVAVYWMVKDTPEWFLAIVQCLNDDGIDVLPLTPSPRKNRTEWAYHQNCKVYTIEEEQLIQRNIAVGSFHTERVKCVITNYIVLNIDTQLKNQVTEA